MSLTPELEAIKTANDTGDLDTAVTLSDAYVAANPNVYAGYETQDIVACVRAIDVFRAAWQGPNGDGEGGFEPSLTSHVQMQAWIYHQFPFQKIGGTYDPGIRISFGTAPVETKASTTKARTNVQKGK